MANDSKYHDGLLNINGEIIKGYFHYEDSQTSVNVKWIDTLHNAIDNPKRFVDHRGSWILSQTLFQISQAETSRK